MPMIMHDNSELSTYCQCQLKMHLRYDLNRKSNLTRIATEVGSSVHAVMDVHLSGDSIGDAMVKEFNRLTSDIESDNSEGILAYEKLSMAVSELQKAYPVTVDDNGTICILDPQRSHVRYIIKYRKPEIGFCVPLDYENNPSYYFTGKMDCILEDANKQLTIWELKTSGSANNTLWKTKYRIDTQPKGYCWALSQHTKQTINSIKIVPVWIGPKNARLEPEINLIYTPEMLEQWRQETIELFNEIQSSSFKPTGKYSGICSSPMTGICDYFDYCRSGYKEEILMQITHENKWSPLAIEGK